MGGNVIQEKSFAFALDIIRLYQTLIEHREYVLANQLLRSGTSIGANVVEAAAGQSTADFLTKMTIASKEARETQYWLRLYHESHLVDIDVRHELASVEELIRILTAIVKSTGERLRNERKITQNSKLKIQNSKPEV
jgi:four helix bundle protein